MRDSRLKKEQEKWDAFYASWPLHEEGEEFGRFNKEFAELVLQLVPPGSEVLEAGCGAGWQSLALARTGKLKVTLMDFSQKAIEYARRLFEREGQVANFVLENVMEPGEPKYELVFNVGALEHYTFEEQVAFLQGMASRSRRYVLVLVPNRLCYWYWLWRVQKSVEGDWLAGKEAPLFDMSPVFKAAGLNFLGQKFVGQAWTELFIKGLAGISDELRNEILEIHKSPLIPDYQKAYLIAALGTVLPEVRETPSGWTLPVPKQDTHEMELTASLSDALALRLAAERELKQLQARLAEMDQQVRFFKVQSEEKDKELKQLQAQLAEIKLLYSSRLFRATIQFLQHRDRLIKRSLSELAQIGKPIYRSLPTTLQVPLWKIYKRLLGQQSKNLSVAIPKARKQFPEKGIKPSQPHKKSKRPTVAYLTNRLLDWKTRKPCIGGGERYCLALSDLLSRLGFDVTIYQAAYEPFDETYKGFHIIGLTAKESFSEFNYGICNAFYDVSLDYDFVVYNLPEYASGKVRSDAILICHGIWFDHDNYGPLTDFRSPEWFEHLYRAFSNPAKIVSVDTNSINVIRSLWPELAAKMTYLPNFVDINMFKPPPVRNNKPPVVIFPRRAQVNRGSRILKDILENISEDCQIYWIGEGDELDNQIIRNLTRQDNRLKFITANLDEMPYFFQLADICVIPSIASEGTSLAALEALASGCAVIATTVGGLPNIIQDGVNGLLVDPEPRKIAAAVSYLINNPQERLRLQQAGRTTAEYFRKEIWEKRWVALLQELGWIKP